MTCALKEWAYVIELLQSGRQVLLLRKGGIYEDQGPGRFQMQHDQFLMLPAWEHERLDWVRKEWLQKQPPQEIGDAQVAEPEQVDLQVAAKVKKIWQVPSREKLEQLQDLYCWDAPYLDMRFNYKSDQPLYLIALQVYEVKPALQVEMTADMLGCRSWVPLPQTPSIAEVFQQKVLREEVLDGIVQRIDDVFGG